MFFGTRLNMIIIIENKTLGYDQIKMIALFMYFGSYIIIGIKYNKVDYLLIFFFSNI